MIDREQFAAYLTLQGLSDNTVRVYTAMGQRWTDWAITNGGNPWEPSPLAVRRWAHTVTGTRASLAHARATIRHWCTACGTDDVSAVIVLPRKPSNPKPLLDRQQTVALLQAAQRSGLAGLAVQVGLYTAARRSEIACLAWSDIDIPNMRITLTRPKVRDRLTLPLHPALAAELAVRDTGEQWVFPGRYGGHVAPAMVWTWVQQVAAEAGLGKVTPHMLRRTALTEINDTTKDLRAAQLFAGHSRPETTARYTRVSDDRLRAACDALAWAS